MPLPSLLTVEMAQAKSAEKDTMLTFRLISQHSVKVFDEAIVNQLPSGQHKDIDNLPWVVSSLRHIQGDWTGCSITKDVDG
jgi:hypothetical protein